MTTPYKQQAYATGTGTSPIPTYVFHAFDPTQYDTAPNFQLYSVWVNTITKGIWYLEAFTSSSGSVVSQWRAVAPIVVSHSDPSSSDYQYPIGQTWVNQSISDSITAATNANPCVITSSSDEDLSNGDIVTISGVGGMTELNGNTYTVTVITDNTFSIGVNSLAYGVYTSGGIWENLSGNNYFVLVNVVGTVATWIELSSGMQTIEKFLPDTGTSPVVPTADGEVSVKGQTVPNVSGIRVTGATNELDIAMYSPFKGDFTFTDSLANNAQVLSVTHTDNTSQGSHALQNISTGGTASGNSWVQWNILGSKTYSLGINNAPASGATGALNLFYNPSDTGGFTSGTNYWNMTTTGARTMPLQPAFGATVTADQSNLTGDGTNHIITTYTEQYDRASNFNAATGVFTAPVTGIYQFNAQISLINLDPAATGSLCGIVTTDNPHYSVALNPAAISSANEATITISCAALMTAGNTAYLVASASGTTKTVGIRGTVAAGDSTKFSGFLVC